MPPKDYDLNKSIYWLYRTDELILQGDNKININYQTLLRKDDSQYNNKLKDLELKIDKALETRNEKLFMELSKEYRMLKD